MTREVPAAIPGVKLRCDHWTFMTPSDNDRCPAGASVWLFDPDNNRCPGGAYCEEHGRAIVREYKEKLGEEWTLEPVKEA